MRVRTAAVAGGLSVTAKHLIYGVQPPATAGGSDLKILIMNLTSLFPQKNESGQTH
jgi:hypothetical protein